jgi:hypothetical protein
LLDDDEGLRLGSASRLVVAREGEEDDEPGEDREPGREHAEDARGPVAVREVAAVRSSTSDEQDRRDRSDDGQEDDEAPSARFTAAELYARRAPSASRRMLAP